MTTAHVVGDVQLMRDQAGALAAQAAPRHAVLLALELARAVAQGKAVHAVDLAGEQTVLRLAEHQFAVEQHFTQGDVRFLGIEAGAGVGQQPILFMHFVNVELPAFVAGNGVARVKHHASDRGIVA
ncbi:hypothetical protein SB00610_02250 [Klebsiella quasipneumoniae subsp. similipneumoniae]|nr:hypothetical protein SB00610_02250 [Klebsiella quasipneumoniae subsp. similipneumoniae]